MVLIIVFSLIGVHQPLLIFCPSPNLLPDTLLYITVVLLIEAVPQPNLLVKLGDPFLVCHPTFFARASRRAIKG